MHLTTLIAWHDSGWNGRICRNPKENKYCESFRHIKKTKFGYYRQYEYKKIEELKCENNAGEWADNVQYNGKNWDACGNEVNIFHKYKFNCMVYGWTEKYVENNNIEIEKLKDIFLDLWFNFYYNDDALCFLYCRENPVSDDRVLVACIKPKIKKIIIECDVGNGKRENKQIGEEDFNKLNDIEFYKSLFREHKKIKKIYPYLTIVFDPEDIIFIIPYQELGEYYEYENIPEDLILNIPNEMKKSFLYTTNFLPNEFSCIILEKALEIIKNIKKEVEGNNELKEKLKMFRNVEIDEYEKRIENQLEKLKKLKFNYPGLPSVLRYLKVENGISTYIDAVKSGNEGQMYKEVKDALENNKENEKWGVNRKALNEFNKKSKSVRKLLIKYVPYYPLTKSQIEEIIKQHNKGFINIEKVLENPYLLYEELKPKDNLLLNISFWEIDNWEFRRLGNSFDIINNHRIRAMLIAILKKALSEGHTVLPLTPKELPSVKKDLSYYYDEINNYLPEDVRIDFDRFLELIDGYEDYITEKVWIGETEFEDELERKYKLKLFALKEINEKEEYIEKFINKMLRKSWNVKVDDEKIKEKFKSLGKPKNISEEDYEKAIENQTEVVKILLNNGCSILTGPAGSGKTSVIKVLLEIICKEEKPENVVILAPTGKASVRVKEAIRNILKKYNCIKEPVTIHKFVSECGKFDWEYKEFKIEKKKSVDILIIDEASMVSTELLYNLLQCIDVGRLKRIIFIGDINQLPPVEAGKPFFDLYQYLKRKEIEENKKYVAKLEICLRAESIKIVELSKLYLNSDKDKKSEIIDELHSFSNPMDGFTKYCLKDGGGKERVVVLVWENDPYKALEYAIDEIIKDNNGNPEDHKDFFEYFVYEDKIQILTCTKNRGYLSSYWINYWIRDDSKYTMNDKIKDSFLIYPFVCGDDYADKVIKTENNWNVNVWDYKKNKSIQNHGVFNGMMGYIHKTNNKGYLVVRFYFPTVQTFLKPIQKSLEYAYAITTHKSQGSEFENVIFILPKSRNISKELIYTAITRAKKKLYILTDNLDNLLSAGKHSEVIGRYSILFDSPVDPRHYPEYLRIITLNGDIVRSWQECLIANLLYYENIGYEYEVLYEDMLPDFKLNSKYENKIILWEHLGMMDNERYKKNIEKKLRAYKESGFYIVGIKDIDKESFGKIFEENDKILIVSTIEDVRNSKELHNKIKILKEYLNA